MYFCMLKKILIQAMPCFYEELLPTGNFFQTKAFEIRMDTFSQFCFDITHVSSRLLSLSQPSFCVGLHQQRFSDILNNKVKRCKDRYMYYDNSHFIENNHLIFHINDYKAHLSSLPSQF